MCKNATDTILSLKNLHKLKIQFNAEGLVIRMGD